MEDIGNKKKIHRQPHCSTNFSYTNNIHIKPVTTTVINDIMMVHVKITENCSQYVSYNIFYAHYVIVTSVAPMMSTIVSVYIEIRENYSGCQNRVNKGRKKSKQQ